MISELGLKGNSLLLFAMIHGFSKDGVNRYRASLKDMCEWLCTSKSTISPTLEALVEAGYINKHDVKVGGVSKPEYTTNYDALIKKAAEEGPLKPTLVYDKKPQKSKAVRNPYPSQNTVESRGTESVRVRNQEQKGYGIKNESGTESVPNKYNINIYKYSSYSELTEAQKQQEEKYFYQLFFFRGAVNPAVEVKRFIAHNQANGWQNKAGAKYDSTEKRVGLAEFWEFKTGARDCKTFLEVWEKVFSRLAEIPNADILLDQRIKFSYENDKMLIHCTADQARFIDSNFDKIKDVLMAHAAGRAMCYKIIH